MGLSGGVLRVESFVVIRVLGLDKNVVRRLDAAPILTRAPPRRQRRIEKTGRYLYAIVTGVASGYLRGLLVEMDDSDKNVTL
jgi:hypothetical protein